MKDALDRLRDWAMAKKIAKENNKFLKEGGDSKIAASRMTSLFSAERKLMRIKPGPMRELERWQNARKNPPCDQCFLSSIRSNNHPECNLKIKEYFESDDALYQYALGFLPQEA